MERLATSYELPYLEPTQADTGPWDDGEDGGLAALLVMATPLALAAWYAIGLAVHQLVT
ncbi:MAG TPA: hypothetical protein VH650_00715 [Gaiellaceae bacterium]|jgi:hypothetical protein